MPKIIYVTTDGSEFAVEGKVGASVMETAVRNGVPGIVAECGGSCMCATCHVYVEDGSGRASSDRSDDEEAMLEEAIDEVESNSRLSCQIRISDAMNGLKVRIAQNE